MCAMPISDEQFSSLADGELSADEQADVLLSVLDDDDARGRLRGHLAVRRQLRAWRQQAPRATARVLLAPAPELEKSLQHYSHSKWASFGQLAVAAVLGGVLVLGAVAASRWTERAMPIAAENRTPAEPAAKSTSLHLALVSAERQRQVAEVFAFYESVTGPIKSYVDSEGAIAVEPLAAPATAGQPIAILIRFADQSRPGQSLTESLVVTRENVPTKFTLHGGAGGSPQPDLYVIPSRTNGEIDVRYAISLSADPERRSASITGWKKVGLEETSLGGLSLGDRSLEVSASAWAVQ